MPKKSTPSINDIEWTDHVLGLLDEEEKIQGNPTTDGLRRIFEIALACQVVSSRTNVVQSPSPQNEKRATVIHTIEYATQKNPEVKISVDGSADVYWGNCDKVFRNHPVAVAETRAEGRSLRRALRLRKVLAAEEVVAEVEDISGDSVTNITNNQINFIDVLSKRLDIDVIKMAKESSIAIDEANIHKLKHEDAVELVKILSEYQLDMNNVPETIKPYNHKWK